MARWRGWWRLANIEQAGTVVLISVITITFMSMLAFSTVFGLPDLPNSVDFLRAEGQQLQTSVGGWFGVLFWAIGALSLFGASLGIVDYTRASGSVAATEASTASAG